MLLSMKTTIRSSFSFEQSLLWSTALEKERFTANLFSICRFNSISLMSNMIQLLKQAHCCIPQ